MIEYTLFGLLNQIENNQVVLPAMQRPFVWKEDRISKLIDSLLRGFPIGAVMLWNTKTAQRYRRFTRDIDTTVPQVFTIESSEPGAGKYLVLDGQQRLTSLYVAFKGTYNHRTLYLDVLSGDSTGKDPGGEYYESAFLTAEEVTIENAAINGDGRRVHYVPMATLISISPPKAGIAATKKAQELGLNETETAQVCDTYIRCASILGSSKSLQVIPIDEDTDTPTPVEEILEIFVRVNSGGLVLQKSDLLMSLLDLKWNNIQPQLQELVRVVNRNRPFAFTRDDVLKSLLLAEGAETRFDRLVTNRDQLEVLAEKLPSHVDRVRNAWLLLQTILTDDCKISTDRFFRGGHNALQPFVFYLAKHVPVGLDDRRKIRMGIYVVLMSGIFGSAEARMGGFCRGAVARATGFPLKELCATVRAHYGIKTLDDLLKRHLDLALNIAHGGITIDESNPEALQRDHIFPRSKLEAAGYPYETVNHYANFHFLRGADNLNKSATPPHEWFKEPGKGNPSYTDQDLMERLLTWEDLAPGNFENMIQTRSQRIKKNAEEILGYSEAEIDAFLSGTAG